MNINSLHDAQAFEDARLAQLSSNQSLSLPLESRREVTEYETWDDAVSLQEVTQASRTLASLSLSENGTATCLAVDSKLVFVGLSNANILLFDHFGVTRGQLEAPPEAGQATSLDSYQNSLLLSSYEDGRIILWDASTGQRLLEVVGPTGIPVSMIRWYRGGQSCVSVDATGVAYLFKFSKTFLLNTFTADRKLLLDGRSRQGFGPIFNTRVLSTDSAVGLTLAAAGFTLVVRLEPEPTKIAHRWELQNFTPDTLAGPGSPSPCLCFHPSALLGQDRVPRPTIVRCFDSSIEYARTDQMLDVISTELSLLRMESPTIACEWISDCCISILDSNYQFKMIDTQASQIVGRCDATRVQIVSWTLNP